MNRERTITNRKRTPLHRARPALCSMLLALLAFVAFAGVSACDDAVVGREGDSDASSAELTLCQEAAESLCTQACDCQTGDRCFTVYGDGVATAEFDDLEHCRTFTAFTCSGGDSQVQTCIDQLATSTCASETHDGEQVEAFQVPMECVDVNI